MGHPLPVPDTPVVDAVAQSSVPQGVGTHIAALGGFLGALTGYIPAILALIPAVYYCLLIYESKTVQGILERRRARHHK